MTYRWTWIFAVTVLWTTLAVAAPITVLNPSFETPALGSGAFTSVTPPNWTDFGPSFDGVFNPQAFELSPPTNGVQVGYINAGGIFQVLTANLTANTVYTLMVDFLARIDCCGWPGAELDLLAGSSVVASGTIPTLAPGAVTTKTVTFTALSGNPLLGQALEVRILSAGNGGQIDFDNVRLDGTSFVTGGVPEPASVGLAGAGVLLLAMARRLSAQRRRTL